MKKSIVVACLLCIGSSAFAADRNFDGYSYFAVGIENFRYSEKFVYNVTSTFIGANNKTYVKGSSIAVKSKINVNSPVYLSGGLIRFNDKWDLSMDFASTLKPNTTTEDWLDRGDDTTILSNYATIMSNSMKFLMHYKLTNEHRLTCGVSYILNTFKRFSKPTANNKILVEETSSTATLDLGYWFESNTAAKKGFRIKYEITGGFPIYQNLENTAAPGLTFTKSTGFNFDTSLYMGYTLFRGFEMGVFANYSYMYREGETKTYNGQTVIWPTNITQSVRGGLQVTWKFD